MESGNLKNYEMKFFEKKFIYGNMINSFEQNVIKNKIKK